MTQPFIDTGIIRSRFSALMSAMYRQEVPLYGDLLDLVAKVNDKTLTKQPALKSQLVATGELSRLNLERHGAIRLGHARELFTIRRLFAVMGMHPVGYYDLAPAGVPVHSTAFRALDDTALNQSPFRVFTSLLRLDLIADKALRKQATAILNKRQIFTQRALDLIATHEQQGGLTDDQADEFVSEALTTFRWHDRAMVSKSMYEALLSQHRLIADVVAFKGPHINHLTPRTLDIDKVQAAMKDASIAAKTFIEGPPRRHCPILLRQTSFKALQENIVFTDQTGGRELGSHTARFGEIEQRGIALTDKGRALYDERLARARAALGTVPTEDNASDYHRHLNAAFADFPDDYQTLYTEKLAYFHHLPSAQPLPHELIRKNGKIGEKHVPALLKAGCIRLEPMVYEDFLPVSAAGIFQSNLGNDQQKSYTDQSNQAHFEDDLGAPVNDLMKWYENQQQRSIASCLQAIDQR